MPPPAAPLALVPPDQETHVAFRRRFTPRRRRSFGGRRRSFHRPAAQRPRRYNVSPFRLTFDFIATAGDPGFTQNIVAPLALIENWQNSGGSPTLVDFRQNAAFQDSLRAIDVGGVVMHWFMLPFMEQPYTQPDETFANSFALTRIALVSDRVDSLGAPDAIVVPWFTGQYPSTTLDSEGSLGDATDADFPDRIHWQVGRAVPQDWPHVNTGGQFVPNAATFAAQGTVSKRLRLRVREAEALLFHFAYRYDAQSAPDHAVGVTLGVTGMVYWRNQM